jgi:subtilisin
MAGSTGRYVVVFSDDIHGDEAAIAHTLRSVASVTSIASTSDFSASALDAGQARAADATVFAELGVAVVAADPEQAVAMAAAAAGDRRVLAVEPERIFHAIPEGNHVDTDILALSGIAEAFADSPERTWGLLATGAATSPRSGRGISVAILDTGFNLGHPDFTDRAITTRSFVEGEPPQDGHGHGTHCVGTACGSANPPSAPRYGVASAADIMVGKVLSNQGSGTDSTILAGMSWAIANGCRVISMSLGADVRKVSMAYETVGLRALAAGTLIVAAAGNNASRASGDPGFVGVPANSPSIMAVAAVDSRLGIANFSARSTPVDGGQVDVAAPGVGVYSTWPMPKRYNTISGTSMATPHVAGIAALWSEATGATGSDLWSTVLRSVRSLDLSAEDVGTGLTQAPQ